MLTKTAFENSRWAETLHIEKPPKPAILTVPPGTYFYASRNGHFRFAIQIRDEDQVIEHYQGRCKNQMDSYPEPFRFALFSYTFEVIFGPNSYEDTDRFQEFMNGIFEKIQAGQTMNSFLFGGFNLSFTGTSADGEVNGIECELASAKPARG